MNKRAFISHASEDKEAFVRKLALDLREKGVDVWYDEYEIKPGMSIRTSVDHGLSVCDIGLVVFSKSYFSKCWTTWELNGLVQKMLASSATLIPIYYNVAHEDIIKISPSLSDILGIVFRGSISETSSEVFNAIYPREPILVETRNALERFGYIAPDYYDDWWVKCIEFSGMAHVSDIPWSLPRNPKLESEYTKSYSLTWACLRYNWITATNSTKLNQFTDAKAIVDFINKQPGMRDVCDANLDYLALYAPQLFFADTEFKSKFEGLYQKSKKELSTIVSSPDTRCSLTKDNDIPLCNRLYALLDHDFGNFTASSILRHFIEGEQLGPTPSNIDYWYVLIMLSSSDMDVYPEHVRNCLLEGFRSQYSALRLKEIFINKDPEELAKVFSSTTLMERAIDEILIDRHLQPTSSSNDIAKRICSLGIAKEFFEDRSFRLTIPTNELKYGYRGITHQSNEIL